MNGPRLYLIAALCLIQSTASLLAAQPATAAPLTNKDLLGSPSSSLIDLPDIFLPPFADPLILDVRNNDAYSSATEAALVDQILSDFEDFDGPGRVPGSTAPKPVGPPFPINPALQLEVVTAEDPYAFERIAQDCAPSRDCELPLDYNVTSSQVRLIWSFRDAAVKKRFDDYVDLAGSRSLRVELNGDTLVRRPNFGLPIRGWEYSATIATGSNCKPATVSECLVISVNRQGWFDGPAPWTPWLVVVKGFDSLFTLTPRDTAGHVVTPKDQVKDFFAATIAQSTMSQRCTMCHELDDEQKLIDRHTSGAVSPGDVFLADSIVNEDEVINACVNCHESGLPADFAERRWATPTPQQDINWAQIINDETDTWPIEICNRVVGNLDTFSHRFEHFHEDARLFWAVADGVTPFGEQLTTAQPKDYDLFLDRFDEWNLSGAPCPSPVPEPGFALSLLVGGIFAASRAHRRGRGRGRGVTV